MDRKERFELYVSGIAAVVCPLLLNGLLRQFWKGPGRNVLGVNQARPLSVAQSPTSSRERHKPRRIVAAGSSNAATKSRSQPQARAARHPLKSEQARPTVLHQSAGARLQAVAPPQPKTITLEPLGYVEKANGRVEAIISLGEHIQVVHEGEILEDKFRVAKVSSSVVKLVENSALSTGSEFVAESGQRVAQAPSSEAPPMPLRPFPEVVSNSQANRQSAADSVASGSPTSVRQELGYVERADGQVEAIVAEGEHVRLARAPKSFASSFRVPAPSSPNLQVADASAPAKSRSDSLALESPSLQKNSNISAQEAGGPPLVAMGSEPSAGNKPQEPPASKGESESEPFAIVPPEALADYSGSRLQPRDLAPVPQAGPAGALMSRSATQLLPLEGKGPHRLRKYSSGAARSGGFQPATPLLSSEAGRMPALQRVPQRVFPQPAQPAVNTLGYVEKAGGEKEAIVEVLGQVYLVHEGELFAEKYRALQVTSSSVQIVEEPTEASSLPSEIERDSRAVRPPISRWRAPPLPTGSSGTDPPVEPRKVKGLAAGKPVVSPSRSPPRHSVESCEGPKRVQTPRPSLESVSPAEQWAQTGTRSPPCASNTVGFVEKASGETEVIAADEGGVYFVPGGRVPSDGPSLETLPTLEKANLVGNRASRPRRMLKNPSEVGEATHSDTALSEKNLAMEIKGLRDSSPCGPKPLGDGSSFTNKNGELLGMKD